GTYGVASGSVSSLTSNPESPALAATAASTSANIAVTQTADLIAANVRRLHDGSVTARARARLRLRNRHMCVIAERHNAHSTFKGERAMRAAVKSVGLGVSLVLSAAASAHGGSDGVVTGGGYYRSALVCVDFNDNARCDRDEPRDFTDASGRFSFR